MFRVKLRLSFVVICLLASSQCFAVSGNDLVEACKSSGRFEQGFCLGFVRAVKYSVADFPNMENKCKAEIAKAPATQLINIVLKKLQDEPEQRHYSAYSIAWMALSKGFGCIEN
jgi:hypothetical protein